MQNIHHQAKNPLLKLTVNDPATPKAVMSVAGNKLGGRFFTHVSGKIYSLAFGKKGKMFKIVAQCNVLTTSVYSNQFKVHS